MRRNSSASQNPIWQLASEGMGDFYGDRVITRLYQSSGMPGQLRGFQLGSTVGSAGELEQTYELSGQLRVGSLTSKSENNSVSRSFTYGYETGTDWFQSVSSGGFAHSRTYDPNQPFLNSVAATWNGGAAITAYAYTYDARGLRATARQSGSAFADYGSGLAGSESIFRKFTYNGRGEVESGVDYLGNNVGDESRPLPSRAHEYRYDAAGNRTWTNRTADPGLQEEYTSNALNQYTSKENHTLAVAGSTASGATVAVGGQLAAAGQQGRFWSNELTVANSNGPWSGSITVYASLNGLVRSETRSGVQLPPASQTFGLGSYDADGNLLADRMWTYSYDAENRLVGMETSSEAQTAGIAHRKLEFTYDYLGRRVQKLVSTWSGSAWVLDSGRRYLYDGWNLVAEYTTTGSSLGSLVRSYTWGVDIAGTLGATGGVGALVQITDHVSDVSYLPTYDGNGNLTALVNASNGALAAAYEYDPFGQLLRCEGTYAKNNPFRFSTKFTDEETGLIYYGLRYYSPHLGRFINRDPIEEAGGLNLYGFVGNNPINGVDALGMGLWEDIVNLIDAAGRTISDVLSRVLGGDTNFRDDGDYSGLMDDSVFQLILDEIGIEGGGRVSDYVSTTLKGSNIDVPYSIRDKVRRMAQAADFNGEGLIPTAHSVQKADREKEPWEVAFGIGVTGTVSIPGVSVVASVGISKTLHVFVGWPPRTKVCVNVSFTIGASPTPYAGVGIETPVGFSKNGTLEGPAVSTGVVVGGDAQILPVELSAEVAKNDNAPNITAAGSGAGMGIGKGVYAGPVKVFSGTACYSTSKAIVPGIRDIEDVKATREAFNQAVEAAIAHLQGRM